jgi:large repetitive protein
MRILVSVAALLCSMHLYAQPANDDCAGAIVITPQALGSACTAPIAATTLNATASTPSVSCGTTEAADDDIWYSFTAASHAAIVRVSDAVLIPSGTGVISFEIYSGACGSLVPVECNTNFAIINGNKIVNGLTSGNVYFIRFWSVSTVSHITFNFCIQTVPPPPVNDECAGAIAITTQPFGVSCAASVSANTSGATQSTPPPSCGGADSNDDIWYSFVANSQSVILRYSNGVNTITGSANQGLGYALYNTACPVSSATISCSDAISALGNGYRIIDGLTIGNIYYLRLFSDNSNNYMSFDFCVQDVPPPPANDNCAGATVITTQPFGVACSAAVSANTTGATHSSPDPSCGVAESNDDIWYSFTANSKSVILRYTNGLNTTTGSTTQGLGYALYNAACPVSTATISCSNAISALGNGYRIIDGLTIGNTYYLRLFSDNTNNYMSFNFCIQDVPPPPANDECSGAIAIVTQPFGISCAASVSVNTTGATHSSPDPPCGVADSNDDTWYSFVANSQSIILRYSNGVNTITGSTTQGLGYALYNASCPASTTTVSCSSAISVIGAGHQIIDGLSIGNTYYLRLFSYNSDNYMSVDFCVQDVPPPPANNECTNAQPISLTLPGTICVSNYSVTTAGATQSAPNPGCTSTANNDDVWYSFTASAATAVLRYSGGTLTTTNAAMSLGYAIYNTSCPSSAATVACSSGFGANAGFTNITGLTAGNIYYLRLFTGGVNNYGSFNFCLQAPLQNDDCANAISIPVSNGFCNNPVLASLNGATTSAGFGVPPCGGTISRDVWFTATVPATGNLIVQTSAVKATGNNTVMEAYSGVCNSLGLITCNNDGNPETGPSAGHSRITLTGRTPGEVITYRVLAAFTSSEEQFAICAWDESAPVLPPVAANGNCTPAITKLIDSANGNTYMWVPLYNSSNEIVAEVYADGNNLGNVNADLFVNTGAVREVNDTFLLDRNIIINPQYGFAARIRFYLKDAEYNALKAADSTIASTATLGALKTKDACSPIQLASAMALVTTAGVYGTNHYLQFAITDSSHIVIKTKCAPEITWTGNVSTSWHDAANWNCSGLPWKFSRVFIPAGMPRYPTLNANTEIKSLDIKPGAFVTVDTGVALKINGQ